MPYADSNRPISYSTKSINSTSSSTPERASSAGALDQLDPYESPYGESFVTPAEKTIQLRYKIRFHQQRAVPGERLAICGTYLQPKKELFEMRYNPALKTASYANVIRCNSPSCAMCAYQRAHQDRRELVAAISEAFKRGWHILMLTMTAQHHISSALNELANGIGDAFDGAWSGRYYGFLTDEWGVQGKVKIWETTYGLNGFHPHIHALIFVNCEYNDQRVATLENQLKQRWQRMLKARGMDASYEHGLHLRMADSYAAEYVSKHGREPIDPDWGAESEMTQGMIRKDSKDGFTMLEIAAVMARHDPVLDRFCAMFGLSPADAVKRAKAVWVEYYRAFKRRARLTWGKGDSNMKIVLGVKAALLALDQNAPNGGEKITFAVGDKTALRGVVERGYQSALHVRVMRADAPTLAAWIADEKLTGVTVTESALEYTARQQLDSERSERSTSSASSSTPARDNGYQQRQQLDSGAPGVVQRAPAPSVAVQLDPERAPDDNPLTPALDQLKRAIKDYESTIERIERQQLDPELDPTLDPERASSAPARPRRARRSTWLDTMRDPKQAKQLKEDVRRTLNPEHQQRASSTPERSTSSAPERSTSSAPALDQQRPGSTRNSTPDDPRWVWYAEQRAKIAQQRDSSAPERSTSSATQAPLFDLRPEYR